ncbi:MAG: thioredoxin family protein [Chloroflexi bacterium]|nr:thioredoxin family protein [Chloroflexota bacterium]
MVEKVVSAQRFAQGLTYAQYLAQLEANREHFERNDREFTCNPEDEAFFAQLNQRLGPIKVLVLGEDWCPDVQRGLPIIARIADRAGMELRVFPRDKNMDIMNQYLNQGQFMSIPVFAFFDRNWQPLGHWIERPAIATKYMNEVREELAKTNLSQEEARAELRKKTAAAWDNWRQETVKELRKLLSS